MRTFTLSPGAFLGFDCLSDGFESSIVISSVLHSFVKQGSFKLQLLSYFHLRDGSALTVRLFAFALSRYISLLHLYIKQS
jgi:hypothetical protein